MKERIIPFGDAPITHIGSDESYEKAVKHLEAEMVVKLTAVEKSSCRPPEPVKRPKPAEYEAQVRMAHELYAQFKGTGADSANGRKHGYELTILAICKHLKCTRNAAKELITEVRARYFPKQIRRQF